MLYLHIPFCVRKCNYCDFLSGPATSEVRRHYVLALQKEIGYRCKKLNGRKVTSIFWGGGTPSLLERKELELLCGTLRESIEIAEDAEITMECNPGTADAGKLRDFRELGINRLSIGLQSSDPEELRLLGRIHTWEDFLRLYEQTEEAGFQNVSIDLMSGLPGQSLPTWEKTLDNVLRLSPLPKHISAYSLILEEGTKFKEWEEQGKFQGSLAIPSEDLDREMAQETLHRLQKAGLERYEISNFARPGYECRHNCGYWTRKNYLGLGLGAASLLGDYRYSNTDRMNCYLKDPMGGWQAQKLSGQDCMEETIFLGLRMTRGVSGEEFAERFGASLDEIYGPVIERNVKDGLLIQDSCGIRLTERGMDLSNYVMAQFLL